MRRDRLVFLCSGALLTSPAAAQTLPIPPIQRVVDSAGYDLINTGISIERPQVKVGSDELSFEITRSLVGQSFTDTFQGSISVDRYDPDNVSVSIGIRSGAFLKSGSTYTNLLGDGGTLTLNTGTNQYTYTTNDGTVALFDRVSNLDWPYDRDNGRLTSITQPNGVRLEFHYKHAGINSARLQTVTTNIGFNVKYGYGQDEFLYDENTEPFTNFNFFTASSLTAYNASAYYCNSTADQCAVSGRTSNFEDAFGIGSVSEINSAGEKLTLVRGMNGTVLRQEGIIFPGDTTMRVTFGWDQYGVINSVSTPEQTWTYAASYNPTSAVLTRTRTDLQSRQVVAKTKLIARSPRLIEITNELNQSTQFEYDAYGRLIKTIYPEGNRVELTYDARGNVTQRREVAKSGSGIADIVTSASFPATCSNVVTCNKPTSVTDARGYVIDYTYDSVHGGVLTMTSPPAETGAPRAQTRYQYTQRYSWVRNAGGTLVQAATPIWVRTREAFCKTGAAAGNGCSITGDEVVTEFDYGSPSVAQTLYLRGKTVAADGVTLRTCYTYDALGNRISTSLPKAGLTSCD